MRYSRASLEGMSGVLKGTPSGPVSQPGAGHVNIMLAMVEMLMVFCLAHRLFTSKSLLIIRYEQTKLSFQ